MKQEQIIDVLNETQKEFKGINEANIHSADILRATFEKEKLEFAIDQLKECIEHPTKPGYKRHDVLNKIKELEQKLSEL